MARKTDNTVEVVSDKGHWDTQNPEVLDVSGSGVARGIARGEVTIRLSYGGWGAITVSRWSDGSRGHA
jgi:hypothetical protein